MPRATADGLRAPDRLPRGGASARGRCRRPPSRAAGGRAMIRAGCPRRRCRPRCSSCGCCSTSRSTRRRCCWRALLAIVVPLLTRGLRPGHRAHAPARASRCGCMRRRADDLVRSALDASARVLLTPAHARHRARASCACRSTLRDPNALAVLAMILCLTPGTAWGELVARPHRPCCSMCSTCDDEAAFIAA